MFLKIQPFWKKISTFKFKIYVVPSNSIVIMLFDLYFKTSKRKKMFLDFHWKTFNNCLPFEECPRIQCRSTSLCTLRWRWSGSCRCLRRTSTARSSRRSWQSRCTHEGTSIRRRKSPKSCRRCRQCSVLPEKLEFN